MPRAVTDLREIEGLVTALRRRDEGALAQLYDRFGNAVYALALRITGDTGAAEEISLDSFMQLWQHADRFDGSQGSLLNWLLTIARSRAIDRVRALSLVFSALCGSCAGVIYIAFYRSFIPTAGTGTGHNSTTPIATPVATRTFGIR
jgi:hypothetical protein